MKLADIETPLIWGIGLLTTGFICFFVATAKNYVRVCKQTPCKIEKCLSTDGIFFGGVCTNKQGFDGVCEYDCEIVPK